MLDSFKFASLQTSQDKFYQSISTEPIVYSFIAVFKSFITPATIQPKSRSLTKRAQKLSK